MHQPQLSVNDAAQSLVTKLRENPLEYGVLVKKTRLGTTIIDTGIRAKGGFLAGKIVTEICLGGFGNAEIFLKEYGDLELPSIFVSTDNPLIATLGSQFAGWRIKVGDYFAIGSGPARALALKPKELYEKIGYADEATSTVLVLETSKEPPEDVIRHISDQCKVSPDHLCLILTPTSTITGAIQISGRIVETGIHKLTELGFDPYLILHGCGCAPIPPVHPKFVEAMGRTNDAILYAGVAWYTTRFDDDEKLQEFVERSPSSASKSYGRPFIELFKEAKYDFYKIDPALFAPAVLIINNINTGQSFKAGKVDLDVFRKSIGL